MWPRYYEVKWKESGSTGGNDVLAAIAKKQNKNTTPTESRKHLLTFVEKEIKKRNKRKRFKFSFIYYSPMSVRAFPGPTEVFFAKTPPQKI